jgi:hypothetical protein
MLGMGVGAAPLWRVIAEMRSTAAKILKNTRVLFVTDAGDARAIEQFRSAAVGDVQAFDSTPALLEQFRVTLRESSMGTRLYVAGPESFIGLVMKIALEFNLNKDEIRAEGCDRWLLVRDHYSRRLAAYMGVMADAEAPGELPPLKEVFL